MSDDKIKIIQDWLESKKVKNIQSFLGFANFYHWFIFNYSDIVIPLTYLTQKDIPWKFNSSCVNAFNSLKKAFTSSSILTYWISNAQLIMETDALDCALAAILSIVNKDNEVHPVAFHSHTFTAAELNYNTHDKELLAIVVATTHRNDTRSMLTSAKLSVGYLVVGITRELDKEPSLHCYPIYINYK